jgi:hypothetical protein
MTAVNSPLAAALRDRYRLSRSSRAGHGDSYLRLHLEHNPQAKDVVGIGDHIENRVEVSNGGPQ